MFDSSPGIRTEAHRLGTLQFQNTPPGTERALLDIPRMSPDFRGMRLTEEHKRMIREQVDGFLGGGAKLFVYGSRLNDQARGGDVDLLVRTAQPVDMLDQARLHARLEEALQLPVDLLFVAEGAESTHFKRMICAQAQPLAA